MTEQTGAGPEPAHSLSFCDPNRGQGPEELPDEVGVDPGQADRATEGAGRPEAGVAVLPAFDDHHPPEQELIDDCVHCGFCLPTCPTYVLWGEEMDSPRGRIYLMEIGRQGEALNDEMVRHFDQCLGCMACVTACPSGVQYGKLIEATRQQVERRYRSRGATAPSGADLRLFPYPDRLRLLLAPPPVPAGRPRHPGPAGGLLPRARGHGAADARSGPPGASPRGHPGRSDAAAAGRDAHRLRPAGVLPEVNAATARVPAADGCEVVAPAGQGCCGALSLHAGREAEAQAFARAAIETFEAAGVDEVVVNAAGCGSAMKEYGHLRTTTRPGRSGPRRSRPGSATCPSCWSSSARSPRHPLPLRVAWHDACHLGHAQGIRSSPGRPCGHPRPAGPRDRRGRDLLRLGWHLQPGRAGAGGRAGRPQGGQRARHGADLLVTSNPGMPHAAPQRPRAPQSPASPWPMWPRSSTPPSAAPSQGTC